MKVLFVASYNKGYYAPFILEQADALRLAGCEVDIFGVTGKGFCGYLRTYSAMRTKIREYCPDVIHAHYGLCGLLANIQRKVPVVTTYHGSDINERTVLPFSRAAILLSKYNVFVSQRIAHKARPIRNYCILPCGVDISSITPIDKLTARKHFSFDDSICYVLFAGAFDNEVKNYPLAEQCVSLLPKSRLIELKGYNRRQVVNLMCAADALLMTSFAEGSPQVVKEAMACGLPVVSVDVGDVGQLLHGVDSSYVCERVPEQLAEALAKVCGVRTNGRSKLVELGLDNSNVAHKLLRIYNTIVQK